VGSPRITRVSIITPNRNGARFLEQALRSAIAQRTPGIEVEYIVVDGQSTDGSAAILERYRRDIDLLIREPDRGPASAINKGLRRATGDLVAWLNADDYYCDGTLARAVAAMDAHPGRALCFGRCRIVDEASHEIRRGITQFKEFFFRFPYRPAIQSINFISQPAMFFRRAALERAGLLREDLTAAWDYEYILRLWRQGGAVRIPGPPLAAFRWHAASISGRHFARQFKEEYDACVADAGRCSLPALLHLGVRWGIVGCYTLMAWRRRHAHRG
jgi:glycosyltransferase involved in cell wall biosynthesis